MHAPAAPSPSVFRHRDFLFFWNNRLLGSLAAQVESVAVGWQVYGLARRAHSVEQSAFYVGMVGLASFLPVFLLALPAGEVADRRDRRGVLLVCLAGEIVTAGALMATVLFDVGSLWLLIAVGAVFGTSRAFFSPASTALGPMLVPREVLPRAIAWNSLAWQGASIAGPALGGLLCAAAPTFWFGAERVQFASPSLAYAAALLLYAGAVGSLLRIRGKTRPEGQPGSRWTLIREGLSYVWSNKIVLGAISLDLFAVLLGGATALLPVYARDILKVGSEGFGVLRASPAVGAAIIAVWLGRKPLQRRAGSWMFVGVSIFGFATIAFAVSKDLWLSVAALVVLGAGDMVSVYVRQTLVQIVTPDPMRGRVSAVSSVFIGASNELGEFESGVAARLLGPVGAALFGGVGSLVVTGLWSRLFPSLRRADRLTAAP